jgi:hypothetical protein
MSQEGICRIIILHCECFGLLQLAPSKQSTGCVKFLLPHCFRTSCRTRSHHYQPTSAEMLLETCSCISVLKTKIKRFDMSL